MKKMTLVCLLVAAFFCLASSAEAAYLVRPYGTVGGTVIELPGTSDWDTTRYGGGVQGLYQTFENFYFGIDLAFIHAYWYNFGWDVEYLNLLAVAEYHKGIFLLQAGLGPYFGTGINDTVTFGSMFTIGVDIPINERLAIALLARIEVVFQDWYNGDGTTFMPGGMFGLSIKF